MILINIKVIEPEECCLVKLPPRSPMADITVISGGPGKGEHAALSRAGTGAW